MAKRIVEFGCDDAGLKPLLDAAVARHNHLMDLGKKAMGCDRHLLGLKIASLENGIDMPDIFTDPAYVKR